MDTVAPSARKAPLRVTTMLPRPGSGRNFAKFFAYSAALIAVLAVVLAGKGIAALQEAGIVDVRPLLGAPRIAFLGIFPTLEAVLAQVAMLAAVIVGYWYNSRQIRAV